MTLSTIVEEALAQSTATGPKNSIPPLGSGGEASPVPPLALHQPPPDMRITEKISKCFVEARCTDNVLFSTAVSIGSVVLILQTCPILLNSWVYITEPRPINKTNENGEQLEAVFNYNAGYFEACREFLPRTINETLMSNFLDSDIPKLEAEYRCHLNPLFSRMDLSDFSVASLAVILRLGLPALFHMCGAFVCSLAFMLGIAGHLRKTCYTLLSAISYICGSIVLSTAVLMFVCVVDDELAPRMKPNAAGEPSKFSFTYGMPFYSSSLSFVPVQMCACLHAFLYFRRYPTVVEKLRFVPGLEAKLRHAQLDKELGIPPVEQWRRGSLASYLPLPSFISARPSPSHSSVGSLMYMQDV